MSKTIKRILIIAVSILIVTGIVLGGIFSAKNDNGDKSGKSITVFSWSDYIYEEWFDGDESILDIFEEETGININYVTFATSEEMYNELIKNPSACDLLCPSEYMILKMKDEGLIKEFDVPEVYKKNVSPYIVDEFERLGLSSGDKTYACGYMWGTMGLIYNEDKFDADDFDKWNNLVNNKDFSGKITIKDSLRDTYIMAVAMVYEDELYELKNALEVGEKDGKPYSQSDYTVDIEELFNRRDQETIDKVEEVLLELKPKLHSFEVDAGKDDIITGKIDVNFAWSGDAAFAISEAEKVGKTLGYAVPNEGTNVWFDGFVMTLDADVESSIEFLNFISKPINAAKNMEYIGYTSVISGDEDFTITYPEENEDGEFVYDKDGNLITYDVSYTGIFDWMVQSYELDTESVDGYTPVDLSYFYSGTPGDQVVWVQNSNDKFYAQFPTKDVIDRAVVMANFGAEDLSRLNEMWNRVKLLTFEPWVMILIFAVIIIGIAFIVIFKFKDKIFDKKVPDSSRKVRRKGYKVIKIENVKTN